MPRTLSQGLLDRAGAVLAAAGAFTPVALTGHSAVARLTQTEVENFFRNRTLYKIFFSWMTAQILEVVNST